MVNHEGKAFDGLFDGSRDWGGTEWPGGGGTECVLVLPGCCHIGIGYFNQLEIWLQ